MGLGGFELREVQLLYSWATSTGHMKGFLGMGFPGSLGGTTLHTLKLAAVPSSSIFFRSSFPPPPPPPTTLLLSHRLFPKAKSPSPFLFRALSSQTALQTPSIAPQEEKGKLSFPSFCFSLQQQQNHLCLPSLLLSNHPCLSYACFYIV